MGTFNTYGICYTNTVVKLALFNDRNTVIRQEKDCYSAIVDSKIRAMFLELCECIS